MAKAVFVIRPGSVYDDLPEERYQFPRTYLRVVEAVMGDWILYYEPRRDHGRQAYVATARVTTVDPDPSTPDHYYARMADYIEFRRPVPFRIAEGKGFRYFESSLCNSDGSVNLGLFQRAVHAIPEEEYATIARAGLLDIWGGEEIGAEGASLAGEVAADYGRPIIDALVARPVRDAAFREAVLSAYDSTCAMTGLRLVNGGGRAEVEAAHIRPVVEHGPDSRRNGIALARTCHWMFERGLLSLEDDGRILMAKRLVPDRVKRMLNPDGLAGRPESLSLAPHPQFLRYHREHVFVG